MEGLDGLKAPIRLVRSPRAPYHRVEISMRRRILASLALSWSVCVTACGPEGTGSERAPSSPGLQVLDVTAVSARNIRIRWTPKTSGTVVIERADGDGEFARVGAKPAKHGRFLDLALEPMTSYRYRLSHCAKDTSCGPPLPLDPVATPPTRLRRFEVDVPPDGTADDLVLFGIETLDADALTVARMAAVDRLGQVVWEYVREGTLIGPVTEVQLLDDGTLATGHNSYFLRIDLDGSVLYRYDGNLAHHDIDPISGGRFIFLTFDVFADEPGASILGDGIEIVEAGAQFPSWTWLARDHISRKDREPIDWDNIMFGVGHDWTHANALTFDEAAGKIYLNVRNLNRLYCIDYPSGDVLWIMGDGGDFGHGLWAHSHDPFFVSENRFVMFDNGALRPGASHDYSRIIEVEFDAAERRAEIVWEYRETPDFFSFAQGAVHVQPDGNIFVTDGINSRIFEVTRDKRVVWQLRLLDEVYTYKSITVPRSVFEDW